MVARLKSRRAVSLLEIMFAVGLLAAVSLALMGLFGFTLRLTGQNRDAVTATHLGHAVLEKLAAGNCQVPAAAATFSGQPAVADWPPAPYPEITVGDVPYSLQVVSTPVPGVPGLVAVQVLVSWAQSKKVTLHAYHHRP